MNRSMIGGAILAAALFGGGIAVGQVAGIGGTSAASPAPTTTQPSTGAPPAASSRPSFPAHGSAAHENAEKAVTGSAASQAQAAAVKSVGSGTAGPVTSDFQGNGYEVTVTRSDGSTVDVHMDSAFNVQDGPGR